MNDMQGELEPTTHDDAYTHVGRALRRLRLEHGLTQAQAARLIAVSPQQYQKYEDAQSKCSLNYLIVLANHYGVSVNALLPSGEVEEPAPQEKPEIATEADLLARLVTAFVRLDDTDEKLRFVQLVEAVGSAHHKSD